MLLVRQGSVSFNLIKDVPALSLFPSIAVLFIYEKDCPVGTYTEITAGKAWGKEASGSNTAKMVSANAENVD